MTRLRLYSSVLLVLFVTEARTQFFDFFGIQPLVQQFQTPKPRLQYVTIQPTTKRHNTRKHTRKTTTVSYDYHSSENENTEEERHSKRKSTAVDNVHSTVIPIRKTTKIAETRTSHRNSNRNTNENDQTSRNIYNADSSIDVTTRRFYDAEKGNTEKETFVKKEMYYEKPISSNIADDYYNFTKRYHIETVTKSAYTYYEKEENRDTSNNRNRLRDSPDIFHTSTNYNIDSQNDNNQRNKNRNSGNNNFYVTDFNNNNENNNYNYNNNNQRYTTRNPLHRPGVKPAVEANGPPITNRPTHSPVTYRPTNRPVTHRPIANNRPTTKKQIAVFPRPTDAGSIAFPEDEDGPEIYAGPDEDYMSDVDKRRYIDLAERMCDKYKSLNTKQLQAIPLIPSPEPVQVNISNCAPTNVPLVVGGKVVTINEFPHMALLGWVKIENGGYSWKCGGSLISDQYVLTAAHCGYQDRDNSVITGAPRVVQLGSSFLDDPGALVVRIAAVIRHPKYKSPKSYYDLALIKLANPVTFSEVIRPACIGLPPSAGQPIIATGWGQTKFGGDQSIELRSVSLPVWDMESCTNVLGTSRKLPNGPMSDSQMCAGDRRGGKDTCQGDSGGPAQLQEDCAWRVVAVTSLGRSCGAPNTPGLYAKVQRAFIAGQVFGGLNNRNNDNHNLNNNNNGHTTRYNNNRRPSNENRQTNDGNMNNHNYESNNHKNNNYDNNRRDNNQDNNGRNNQRRVGVNNDYSSDNQNYNPHSYTTEKIAIQNDYQNSFSNTRETNNNRHNRQGTTENSNQRNNNRGNDYNSNNYNNEFSTHSESNRNEHGINKSIQSPSNYETSYNQDDRSTNSPRYYRDQLSNTSDNEDNNSGSDKDHIDYSNNHQRNFDYNNNNQHYNNYNRQQDGIYFT